MGQMFYRALRANGVETAMVIYPGEGHGIRQPKHRVDVLRRTLDWFQAHDTFRPDSREGVTGQEAGPTRPAVDPPTAREQR